jgi:very-short-patch-repair endonuclease
VNIELDGAKYHFAPIHRERDMRRDAALAKLGWLTLRFSHDRLVNDTDQLVGSCSPSSYSVAASLESDQRSRRRRANKMFFDGPI